jgi:UDP-glucose 4-epimerase
MILVTGASGFIGSHMVGMLTELGYDIVATGTRNHGFFDGRVMYRKMDITDPEEVEEVLKYIPAIDTVIHLAAALMIDDRSAMEYYRVNDWGTANMLEWARRRGVKKFIYTMTHSDMNRSCSVYIDESSPSMFGPVNYGDSSLAFINSKVSGMNSVLAYNRDKILTGIILRLANVRGFGSRDAKYDCVFHQFVKKAMNSEPIEIWGAHETKRDFIYVKDVCRAIWMASVSQMASGIYNIGSGRGLTIEDEAKTIIDVFSNPNGQRSELIYRPDIEEVRKRSCIFKCEKAYRDFEWHPAYSYHAGLSDMKKMMQKSGLNL